jgi:hypothetical protein
MALRQQIFFTHQQVAERGQQVQPVIVFGQAAIADFAVTKDLFDGKRSTNYTGMVSP